ncbi:MAG: helix-turn-helix domain-containing protein [Candidatus Woesearchaeota archaeon]
MDISLFKKAGLTEGEIKVYLALLEKGLSTTGPIIKKSGISKSIVYPILEKLIEKGLVSYIIKEKIKHFQAAGPDKILEYVNKKEDELSEVKEKIEELLPQLELKQKLTEKSEATIYLGYKGLRTCHEKIYQRLKRGENIYYLGVPAYQPEEQHRYWKKDHVKRMKSGIGMRALFNKGTDPKILRNRNSYKGSIARIMPTDIKTPALFGIYKDTVQVMLQSPTVITVEITNQDIADSFKAYFDEFWKRSKPFRG